MLVYITGAHCEINLETSARRASAVASNCTEWYSPPLTSTYAACAGWQDVDIGTHSNAGLRVQIDRGLGALFFFFFFITDVTTKRALFLIMMESAVLSGMQI